jgi:predicted dienelactone hydrolase
MYFYKMNSFKNIPITGSEGRIMATDIFYEQTGGPKPVVVYAHGFNGFKDWGNFDLIATQFVQAGFVFVKFNFSHNGTTTEQPDEFVDLEAFGQNNYTKQLIDLGLIIDWVSSDLNPHRKEMALKEIYVCGHSMGGGIAILKAA